MRKTGSALVDWVTWSNDVVGILRTATRKSKLGRVQTLSPTQIGVSLADRPFGMFFEVSSDLREVFPVDDLVPALRMVLESHGLLPAETVEDPDGLEFIEP